MNKRSISETLLLLCCSNPEHLKKSGELNVTRAAALMKVRQPTLKRLLDGESKMPNQQTLDKICRYFKVTADQLFGRAPIPWIDAIDQDSQESIKEINDILARRQDLIGEFLEYVRFRDLNKRDNAAS